MKEPVAYTDIGHQGPGDTIWLFDGSDIQMIRSVTGQGTWSHERLWGGISQDRWRGRYEAKTGFCSIAPPCGEEHYKRPPAAIIELLKARFSVFKFYYFAGGVESFSPNPRRK